MAYLNLIRYPNLIIVLLTQVLLRYALFEPFGIQITLSDFGFALLVIASLCLTAGGNVINDIFDVDTDKINKPNKCIVGKTVSEKAAYNLFIALNIVAVGIGFYLSNSIGKPSFSAIFIGVSGVLYLYASYLKRTILIGNIIISLLVAFVILVVAIYDLMPAITVENRDYQNLIFRIMLDYAVFAFSINFLRELIKDQEDIKGDHNAGIKSLPIVLGQGRTNTCIGIITLGVALGLVYYINTYLYQNTIAVLYVLVCLLGPLLYVMIKICNANTKQTYHHLSSILKSIMVLGLLSIGLYQFMLH